MQSKTDKIPKKTVSMPPIKPWKYMVPPVTKVKAEKDVSNGIALGSTK
jgi:hypothetical protein